VYARAVSRVYARSVARVYVRAACAEQGGTQLANTGRACPVALEVAGIAAAPLGQREAETQECGCDTPTLAPVCARACTVDRTLGKKCCLASGHMRSRERAHAPLPCLMRVQQDSARPKRAAPSACNNATAAPPIRASLSPASPRVEPRACGAGARAGRALPPWEWRLPGLQIETFVYYLHCGTGDTNSKCSWIVSFQRTKSACSLASKPSTRRWVGPPTKVACRAGPAARPGAGLGGCACSFCENAFPCGMHPHPRWTAAEEERRRRL
jgi:hypothetical protein